MLNPVFHIKHMRHMSLIFYKVAHKVCHARPTSLDSLLTCHKLRDAVSKEVQNGARDVDILEWMGRAALELIGQGGLGYSFDPLTERASNSFGDTLKSFL